jgi:SIR2-like domain
MSIPKSLVEAVREHRVVPFVGAGVSVGVKQGLFPAWKSLLEGLAGYMEEERVDEREVKRVRGLVMADELVLAAEAAHRALGPYLFHGYLRTHYRRQRPGDANLDVVRGIWALRPPLVITTNYDSVLHWGGPAEVQIVGNDQHEELALLGEDASSDWPWIWHLHGTIERMATVILAGRDYKRLYEKDERNRVASYERALFELQKTLASRSLLYIGFGLTDPYVLEQIAHVLELSRGNVAPSYALMKQGQGNRGDLWENYNVRLIEYEDHGAPLAALLQQIAVQAFGVPPAAPPADAPAFLASSGPPMPAGAALGGPPGGLDFAVDAGPAPDAETTGFRGPAAGSPVTAPKPAAKPAPIGDRSLVPEGAGMGSAQNIARRASPPAPAALDSRPVTRSAQPAQARSAITPTPIPQSRTGDVTPEPAKPIIERTRLVEELGRELRRSWRLLLLAQQGGGVRRLAAQIAEHHFGDCVTWLNPPRVPDCTEAEYCRFLAGNESIKDFLGLLDWLAKRARARGRDHLVVLRHDGGPLPLLSQLGDTLRTLIDEPRARGLQIHVLVAGEAATARLRYEAIETSLFSGAQVRHVPVFSVDEVAQVLDLAKRGGARWGKDVWQATGGLPGLVVEAVTDDGDLDHASVTARLSRSTAVHGRLRRRVLDDDRAQVPAGRHARAVLQALLDGRAVKRLDTVEDELDHAEVRLYYDGLVAEDERGETRFLCEAVRCAAAELLALESGTT